MLNLEYHMQYDFSHIVKKSNLENYNLSDATQCSSTGSIVLSGVLLSSVKLERTFMQGQAL